MSANINTSASKTNTGMSMADTSGSKFLQSKIPSLALKSQQTKNRMKARTTYNQQPAILSKLNSNTQSRQPTQGTGDSVTKPTPSLTTELMIEKPSTRRVNGGKGGTFYSPRITSKVTQQQQQYYAGEGCLNEEETKEGGKHGLSKSQIGKLRTDTTKPNEERKKSVNNSTIQGVSKGEINKSPYQNGANSSQLKVQSGLRKPTKILNAQSTTVKAEVKPQLVNSRVQSTVQDKKPLQTEQEPDDDFMDDAIDNSMELQETNTIATSAQTKSKPNSVISSMKGGSANANNKINTTSPSKVTSKFAGNGTAMVQQSKQQNVKASVITGKKTLQSLMQDKDSVYGSASKPLAQLDLNLSMTNLQSLPLDKLMNNNLRSVDLRNNRLTSESLVPELFNLENVWKLQLDNNQIVELPDLFDGLHSLRHFTVATNQIKKLPDSLLRVKNLEKLELSNNKLIDLPQDIEKLSNLKYLYLTDNQIVKLPKSLGNLTTLQQLSIEWCQYIKPTFEKLIKRSPPQQSNNQSDDSLLQQFLQALTNSQSNQVSFFEFMQYYYNQPSLKSLLSTFYLYKQATILHYLCKYNHLHLFEHLALKCKQYVDINALDGQGQSPLVIALNEKHNNLVDRLIRVFKDTLNFIDFDSSSCTMEISDNSTPTKQIKKCQHPLMLAVKNLQYETALRILALMVKQASKNSNNSTTTTLDLNMKDEYGNTLMHYLFLNFSSNMELSVELCQELLKQYERGQKTIPASVVLNLNEPNKQGMTPFDLATEVKQNQAIEFAIYYNKNMLPAFQNSKKSNRNRREVFDINCNKNIRMVTPLHRAIQVQNYKAIYLLLQSGDCNLLLKDREYRSARDYCQKILFLSKYLRKGESNQLRYAVWKAYKSSAYNQLQERRLLMDQIVANGNPQTLIPLKLNVIGKPIQHNNINFFVMSSKRGNRVKYNSWYTRLNPLTSLSANKDSSSLNVSNGNTKQIVVENVDDRDQQPLESEIYERTETNGCRRESSNYSGSQSRNQIRVEDLKDDACNVLEEEVNSQRSNSQIQESVVSSNKRAKPQETLLMKRAKQITERKQSSLLKPQQKNNARRLSDQRSKMQQAKTGTGIKPQSSSQLKSSFQQKPSPKTQDKRTKIEQQHPITNEFEQLVTSQHQSTLQRREHLMSSPTLDEDYNFSECEEEPIEANEESPSTLPSSKYKYVMAVNNSKLARKPYYKHIQKNRFEREFCMLMDPRVSLIEKAQKLYTVFSQVQQNVKKADKDLSNSYYKDGREFLGFLKLEMENKDENLLPLKNEILYFQEIMYGNQNLTINLNDGGSLNPRKNTNNLSLERHKPLAMIKEDSVEKRPPSSNHSSPLKKPAASNRFGFRQQNKPSNSNQNTQVVNTEVREEQPQIRLNTVTSQKKLDVIQQQSIKQQNSFKNPKTNKLVNKNEDRRLFKLQATAIHIDKSSIDKDSNKSPTSPKLNSNSSHSKTSSSKAFSFQSPSQASSLQQSSLQKTKDFCIKKIEVQITNKQSPQQNKFSTKWRKLTINPDASQSSNSSLRKGVSKANSKLSQTPQSSKGGTNPQQQTNKQTTTSTIKMQQKPQTIAQQNKTSSQLSNRSNSNPRNSLLSSTNSVKTSNQRAAQKRIFNQQTTSTVGKTTTATSATNTTTTTNTSSTVNRTQMNSAGTGIGSGISRLKAPTVRTYNRHTFGTKANITAATGFKR